MTITPRCVFVHWARLGVRGDGGMSLPLLALRPGGETAMPFPDTTVTFTLEFNPAATRILNGASFTGATAVLTVVNKLEEMSEKMRNVTAFLRDWVCSDIIAKKGGGTELPNGGREWPIEWAEFNESIARYTCPTFNSPGGPSTTPYALTIFRQSLLDDNGRQLLLFTFAVYADRLGDAWVAPK
jgi:hypothetical protein